MENAGNRFWLLQGNPQKGDSFADWLEHGVSSGNWRIRRYKNPRETVRKGDGLALWDCGPSAGVYGFGAVSGYPYRKQGQWYVPFKVVKVLEEPLAKDALRQDAILKHLAVVRTTAQGSSFPLTANEWLQLWRFSASNRRQGENDGSVLVVDVPITAPRVEAMRVTRLEAVSQAVRAEARLVVEFVNFLRSEGRSAVSKMIKVGDETIQCDLFESGGTLVEAKSDISRPSIRMAIGQLMDYRRYLADTRQVAILLPRRPSNDIAELLRSLNIVLIWQSSKDRFIEESVTL